MSERWFGRPGTVFALVLLWKSLLFLVSAQPIPANDAFFYDGPVVNFLLHGRFVNPSLTLAFPIAGSEFFSAYPPLYQLVLLGWMTLFGTSALSAMALHLGLFALYVVVVWAILKQVKAPPWCVRLGGLFLFVLTFHDRPDSLAHVFGSLAVYAWIRARHSQMLVNQKLSKAGWSWCMAVFLVLTLATSLQIGAVYGLLVWVGVLSGRILTSDTFPLLPLLSTVLVPLSLLVWVMLEFPGLWAGFLEHATQTPSLTGLHRPKGDEILKLVRTVPGVLAALGVAGWLWRKAPRLQPAELDFQVLSIAFGVAAVAVIVGCLFVLTPNIVVIAAYLQPVIVASVLALAARHISRPRWRQAQTGAFTLLAILGSIRAIGMSTWGLVCASDVGYTAAVQRVRQETLATRPGQTAVFSAAYLYEAARNNQIRWIHSDWLAKAQRDEPAAMAAALFAVKPAKLVLTQFDYYRRYAPLVAALQLRPQQVKVTIDNCAHFTPPDAISWFRKIVQHVSWAPVVVTFTWK